MRPLRSFATRNYITLILCAIALMAFLGSGLSPVSGSKVVVIPSEAKTNMNALSVLLNGGVPVDAPTPSVAIGRNRRSDAFNLRPRSASMATPFAAMLTATKTDNVSTPVNPGDTIMYTIEITNTGDANATNVNLTDTLDANVTLVPGSVKVAPIAVNDTYNTIGNVNIDVPAPGLLGNDVNPTGSGTLSIQSPPTTTTNGGTLSINATTGAFTYDPPVGFEGSDTFTYTLGNSDTPGKTDTATVTITVSGMIWFINNNAGACSSSCDGRLSHPITSIAAFQAVNNGSGSNPAAGDNIFLYSSGTNYTGPLTLLNTQKLIGQGAPDSILTITGLTAPSGNNLLPATNGADPVITGTNITAITLGQNNQLHGFTVGNTGATGIDIFGASIGISPGLTVKDVTVNGSGQALDLASGTIVSGSTFATIESTGGSAAEGVQLATLAGSFTAATTNIVNPTGTGIDVQSSTVAAGGFNFGATTVNKGSTNGTGVNLNSNTGTFAFSSLTVMTNNGTGVSATSSGTVNVTTGSISATGGPALLVNPTTLGMTFTSVSSTNSSTTGISLTSASGSLAITTTTVTNPSGIGISVNTSSATLNFGNTTSTLSGGTGVSLTTNTGAITFTTLNVNSPDANQRGLLATENSGTITVNGAATLTGGTISTSGATAVEITKTTGATPLNITLRTVSANGGNNGIVLSNTSGSFTVTGDGTSTANGSGGTIQNMNTGADGAVAGRGVSLNNVQNVSLTAVNLHDFNNFAIRGSSVTGFTLQRSVISGLNGNAGGAPDEAAISFDNLLGSATISNTSISHGFEFIVKVLNSSGTLNRLTMDSDTFGSNNATLGGDAVQVVASNTATVNVTVSNCTFSNAREDLFNAAATQTSSMDLVFRQNTLSNSNTPALSTRTNVLLFSTSTGTVTYDISCNKTTGGNDGPAIAAAKGFPDAGSGGTMTGSIVNNKIGAAGVANSGSISASGIFISSLRSGTHTTRIADNVIKHYDEAGIFMRANDGASTLNATITGNVTNEPDSVAFAGFHLDCGALGTDSNIANIVVGDANVAALKNDFTAGDPFNATDVDILETGGSSVINLSKAGSASGSVTGVLQNDNLTPISIQAFGTINLVLTTPATPPAVASCVAPASLAGETISTLGKKDSGGKPEDLPSELEADLRTTWGEGSNPDAQQLRKDELAWFVQVAMERWKDAGISDEDLARIEAVTFELADLPSGQLATASGTHIQIDETGAGYGWFTDITPDSEFEFEVPVPDKEIQTTAVSPAHGRMDLLTVLMRQLGYVYLQGKDNVPTKLLPLMEPTLSPSIRRLPDLERARRLTSSRELPGQSLNGKVASTAPSQPETKGAPAKAITGSSTSLLDLKPAVFNPSADLMPGSYQRSAKRMSFASNARPAAAVSPMFADSVNLGPFTIPPGEKIVIMFSATVNTANTLPPGTVQVCNQGFVSATGIASFGTDDPDVVGTNQPTCTQLNVADVSVTKSAGSSPVCSTSNITFTINYNNAGPAAALNALVSDVMPAGTSLVSVTPPATWTRTDLVPNGGNGTITFTKASSPNADAAVFTIVVSIDGTVANDAVIQNTASVTSDTPDPNTANNTSAPTSTTVKKPPTPATVGLAQSICPLGTTTSLGGNTPIIGTGTWTVQSGGTGTFNPDATTPGATFTHATGTGPIVLRWTISHAPCPDSFAEVTITINPSPATPTITPTPSEVCTNSTGNQASGPAGATTYAWTIGNGTITSAANIQTITYTAGASGNVTLNLTVTNASGCSASNSANVPIKLQPVASVGPNQTIVPLGTTAPLGGNTPPAGATGTWSVTGGGAGTFSDVNAPNSTFTHTSGAGPITLRWTVTNAPCTSAFAELMITLGVPPIISCPASPVMADAAAGQCQAVVTFTVTATGTPTPTVTCTPPSGSTFPVGNTTVNCTATNGVLPNAMCSFTVQVNDSEGPQITLTTGTIELWPPNHSYTTITMSQLVSSVTDNCGVISINKVKITSVSSDEPENVPGNSDGNTVNDIVIAANCKSVKLRAERDDNLDGRVYTINLKVTDGSGNVTTASRTVVVPVNQSGDGAILGPGPGYTKTSSCP